MGEGKKSREENGWNTGGAITGDGEGTEVKQEEQEVDRRPPHVRSPWLRLWPYSVVSRIWPVPDLQTWGRRRKNPPANFNGSKKSVSL